MTITKLLTPYNFTDKNSTARIKYLVIHYVGALGGAKANCQYYASKYIGASAHYYIGFQGEIYQSVEDSDIAWHCGATTYKHQECRNTNSIGIELCVRKKNTASLGATDKDWYFEDATVSAAVELVKSLMKKYNIPASNVIRHYDVTGKICPNPYVYNSTKHTWDDFKAALTSSTQTAAYIVTTTCDELNIRAGAGTNYKATGSIKEKAGHKNKYTIVEEKSGWGRLKSGAGWISLKYTKRV
jgi:N-acetyl-anhydromuramyl-L-alanine amidase AmpD